MRNFERQKVRLGDIAEVSAGQGAPQGDSSFCSVGLPFIRAGHLGELLSGMSESDFPKVKAEVAKERRLKIYPQGSILFAKSGMSCMKGYVYRLKQDSYVVSHLAIISPKNEDTGRFLEYYFRVQKPNLLVKDPAYPSISLTDIAAITLNLPPLAEQKRIAEELDNICAAKKDAEAIVEKLKLLAKSLFVEMFGDPETNVKGWPCDNLANITSSKLSYGATASAVDYDGNTRFVRITDVDDDGNLNADRKSASVIDEKYLLHAGDLLVARTGATVGKSYLYKPSDGRCIYAGFMIRIVADQSKVLPIYLFHLTKSKYYWDFIKSKQRIVAQPNVNAQEYGSLKVCIPPLSIQKEFAAFIEQLDKSQFEAQALIGKLDLLYRAKLQEYFG